MTEAESKAPAALADYNVLKANLAAIRAERPALASAEATARAALDAADATHDAALWALQQNQLHEGSAMNAISQFEAGMRSSGVPGLW